MNRVKRLFLAALAGAVLISTAACSTTAPFDEVGLWYYVGPWEGNSFHHCWNPGDTTDYSVNDEFVLLPTSLRTWKISEDSTDSKTPISVPSAPQEGQPGMLNTNCGVDNKDANSPIVQFWEKIGHRYHANEDAGWKVMLENTIVTALTTVTGDIIRKYPSDVLVAGTKKEEIQEAISAAFTPELKRLVGGDFFCGPTFNRATGECPPVQVLLLPVDYANKSIQEARDKKQAAVELAAAAVAEAQGKLDAAAKTKDLYNNPAWVQLEQAKIKLQQVQECAKAPSCTLIIGADGAVNVNTK